jgi:hypothetical protein
MKIKIILAAGLLLAGGMAAWYVQGLRADNAALGVDNARLLAAQAANQAVIGELQAKAAQEQRLLSQWAEEKAALLADKARLAAAIQKELKINEDFQTWAAGDLPAAAVRLLQPADSD